MNKQNEYKYKAKVERWENKTEMDTLFGNSLRKLKERIKREEWHYAEISKTDGSSFLITRPRTPKILSYYPR